MIIHNKLKLNMIIDNTQFLINEHAFEQSHVIYSIWHHAKFIEVVDALRLCSKAGFNYTTLK